jgi:hypothetical protein
MQELLNFFSIFFFLYKAFFMQFLSLDFVCHSSFDVQRFSVREFYKQGLAPANVHRMGDAFFQREDMLLPIWPSVSPNVRRLSAWKTLNYVCILYASSSVMKW